MYLLAKKFGVKSPEEFAMRLVNHFLTKYRHVEAAHVYIEEYPWKRINYSKDLHGREHTHAFVYTPGICFIISSHRYKYKSINK